MSLRALIVAGGVFLAGAASAQDLPQGDPAEGRKLANMCRTCHGIDGFAKIPIAPHIGGEPAGYIAAQLTAFRSGARMHEMMSVVAASLSDRQIADVAAWYGAQQVSASVPAGADPAPAPCAACHGEDGIAVVEDAPNLAGETNIYIDTQLKAFRGGKREHEVMSPIAAELTDTEIRAFADWYGAVELTITSPE
ncbi:c-type cytochrome [Profundibacterium mesophilum]|uniref:Cb-type cytochrome c oxidase subunit III n=1 Tax=Profundibacterium mesophilum KAUST100406-0324 TaxID=1037889 RepID=A0A921NPW9_9RHOB|nr:c-type cytochrome [Profundibacterium mesophilum]KAF0674822.1 cb-type cytochrome c oxidase subunit III [Profundibacterium mesophilum KAUST100406-0324]